MQWYGIEPFPDLAAAEATERELEHLLRRLATHPHAVNAVLQTARAMRRARDVETWTPAI